MSLKVVYRNWSAEGVPHVHQFNADTWNVTSDGSLLVRGENQMLACIPAGEWMAVWRPEAVEGVAPASKAQKATAAPAAAGENAAAPAGAPAAG